MKAKQRSRVTPRPQAPQPSAPLAQPGAGDATATEEHSGGATPLRWSETLRLLLWAAAALGLCSLLWLIWTRRMLIVFSAAGIIWAGFALAAVFDHLWRRWSSE